MDVADELVFTVSGAEAKPVRATTLPEIGLSERQHLQEWVLAHPEILGPGIKVVTFEFDRWGAAGGDPLDRLDVLGLDRSGRLVVAELKRDAAPDTVEMQAIKYAAMASRFTPETLGHQHARFRRDRGDSVTEETALADLEEHTDDKTLAVETLRQPRIVLLAASFPPVVTATAVWLREMGLDITLMRFQAYQTDTETLVTVSQSAASADGGGVHGCASRQRSGRRRAGILGCSTIRRRVPGIGVSVDATRARGGCSTSAPVGPGTG